MKWRPIATAPRDGTKIMLFLSGANAIEIDGLVDGKEEWWEQVSDTKKELRSKPIIMLKDADEQCFADYWLPLPELPDEDD